MVRAKVLAAASELVAAKGLTNVTLPEIAQRAGIAATSLYRRWGDTGSLLLDMAVERLSRQAPLPDEGSIERDLKCWCGRIVAGLTGARENTREEKGREEKGLEESPMGDATFLRVLIASADLPAEKRRQALAPRAEQLEAMLARGQARGEKVPSLSDLLDFLLAPLYMRALLGAPIDPGFADRLVERLLRSET